MNTIKKRRKEGTGVGCEMSAAQPEDPSLIPGTHTLEDIWLQQVVL